LASLGKHSLHYVWADTRAPVARVAGPSLGRSPGYALPPRGLSAAREEVVGGHGGVRPASIAARRLRLLCTLFGALDAGTDAGLRRAALHPLPVTPRLPVARARGDAAVGTERSLQRGQPASRGGAARSRASSASRSFSPTKSSPERASTSPEPRCCCLAGRAAGSTCPRPPSSRCWRSCCCVCKEAGRRGREGREVPGALCYARASGGSPRRWRLGDHSGATGEATKGVMPCDGPSSPSTTFTPT